MIYVRSSTEKNMTNNAASPRLQMSDSQGRLTIRWDQIIVTEDSVTSAPTHEDGAVYGDIIMMKMLP